MSSANVWYLNGVFLLFSILFRLNDFLEKYQLGQPSETPLLETKMAKFAKISFAIECKAGYNYAL